LAGNFVDDDVARVSAATLPGNAGRCGNADSSGEDDREDGRKSIEGPKLLPFERGRNKEPEMGE
jgi:hypothetical protein